MKKEIKKDDESFKSKKPTRGPASIDELENPVTGEEIKLDKKDRQIGPRSNW